MDTVCGLQAESDCFLTLLWRKSKFMLIFKLESQTTDEVTRIFKILQNLIPLDVYKNLFSIILTNNGHEFFDVNSIECIQDTGEYVTHLFLCDESILKLLNCHYIKPDEVVLNYSLLNH